MSSSSLDLYPSSGPTKTKKALSNLLDKSENALMSKSMPFVLFNRPRYKISLLLVSILFF